MPFVGISDNKTMGIITATWFFFLTSPVYPIKLTIKTIKCYWMEDYTW